MSRSRWLGAVLNLVLASVVYAGMVALIVVRLVG
jgi:hypothetical protein